MAVRFALVVGACLAAATASACGGKVGSAARPASASGAPTPRLPPIPTTGPFAAAPLMADVRWLTHAERAGRGSRQPASAATARWIEARFRGLGLEVLRQPVAQFADNVIAIKRGGPRAVIVSAHYDHLGWRRGAVYPGADDNASGVAVLLAIAAHHANKTHRDTLIFIAFAAEEVGLLGSRKYMASPAWPIANTAAVVNFDMVGRRFFEAGANRDGACAIVGVEDDEQARRVAFGAADAVGLSLVPLPAKLAVVFGQDFRTDEWWFRQRGILAVHFTTGYHHDYHRPTDTADRIVPAQMSRVARTAAGLIGHLAGERNAKVVSGAGAAP